MNPSYNDASLPADLHLHSNRSDGTETPAAVVEQAFRRGIRTIALTDHDTTTGLEEATATAHTHGMTLLPGIEISARHGHQTLHVLGYLIDPHDTALRDEAARIRLDRVYRAQRIVRRIAHDHALRWEDVVAHAPPGAAIGRPHIADALVTRGIVRNRAEAFTVILGETSDYNQPLHAPDIATAVGLIRNAGGVAILAHPASSGAAGLIPRQRLKQLITGGLAGFELGHRDNKPDGLEELRALAAEHDLIVTGSSDYHGAGKPNQIGEHTTAPLMLRRIIAEANQRNSTAPDPQALIRQRKEHHDGL